MNSRHGILVRGLGAGALLALAGCSLIYDAGSFSSTDAAPDGRPDAAVIADADIDGLDLTGTVAVDLAEGSGCVWDGLACTEAARAIPVIVEGANIDGSATVTLSGAGFTDAVVPAVISADHNMLAIAVRIPPDLGIGEGASDTLTITVAQGQVSDQVTVPVAGLDDFVASVDAAGGTRDLATSPLADRYATVTIDSDIRFTGDQPVRLRALSSLALGARLDVSGFDGVDGAAGAAGPGGCRGGVTAGAGQCDASGGKAGTSANAAGGGGGHRLTGEQGVGAGGGPPGDAAGDQTMAPLGAPGGSRGNGGGGGANAGTLNAGEGGTGGGGGGTLVLTSEGELLVATTADLRADGGAGSSGTGLSCSLNAHGGAGGGGSGGGILVRARATFADAGATGRVSVAGGAGGDAGTGAGCNDGGGGSPGRVRIDLPSADADPPLVSGTTAFRGVVIDPALAPIATEQQVDVAVFGAPDVTYRIQVEGQAAQEITVLGNRTGSATVTLEPGRNRVCVLVNDSVTASSDEGAQCVDIAYMLP